MNCPLTAFLMSKSRLSQMDRRVIKNGNVKMDNKNRKCTSVEQYKKMIELFRIKPDIGQGPQRLSKDDIEEFWENVAQELNAKGPPIRNAVQWKKRWLDWKNYIKSKLTRCKIMNTMHLLTQLDEEVIYIAGLDKHYGENDIFEDTIKKETGSISSTAVGTKYQSGPDSHPVKKCHSGSTVQSFWRSLQQQQKTASMDIQMLPENEKDFFSYNDEDAISEASLQYNEEENEVKLLQQQLDIQKNLYKESKEFQIQTNTALQGISRGLNNLKGSIERMEAMNQQRLTEEKRHNRKTEELLQKIVEFRRGGNSRK